MFDGYETVSTKDQEHRRRYPVPLSLYVDISLYNKIPFSQDRFLTLKQNKKAFIKCLSEFLMEAGVAVRNCTGDADCTVVKEAITQVTTSLGPVLVVADDTDIAVLLLYHWKPTMHDVFFK